MPGDISFENPEANEPRSSSDVKIRTALIKIKEAINGGLNNENLSGSAEITRANLHKEAKPVTWYEPKIIATEESREGTSFSTLPTKDEIKEVIVPTNGLLVVGYMAKVKSSVSNEGKIALFVGANQLKFASTAGLAGTETISTEFTTIGSSPVRGLGAVTGSTSFVTTGQPVAATEGGLCHIFVAPGTYNISVQYRANSGSVTAKERKLWVYVLGF